MITPDLKSGHQWDLKRYTQIFHVLVGCISLLIVMFLLENSYGGHIIVNSAAPYCNWLIFASIILAVSIFLVTYYTYNQMMNNRLAIAGFTFLISGVFDTVYLLSYPGMPGLSGISAPSGEAVMFWLLARVANAAGFLILVSMPDQRKDRWEGTGNLQYPCCSSQGLYCLLSYPTAWQAVSMETKGLKPQAILLLLLSLPFMDIIRSVRS